MGSPRGSGHQRYFIRNESPRWRTVEIDPPSQVPPTSYPYPRMTLRHGLDDFGDLFYSFNEMPLHAWPYWVTVKDEKVVAIEQRFS